MKFSFAVSPRRGLEDVFQLADLLDYHCWGNLYCSDHLAWPGLENIPECWTTLTALATRTMNIGIGSLVSPPHFRHPAVMARIISGVNRISEGRLLVGLGTGWQQHENTMFGLDLPVSHTSRVNRLKEYLECLTGLLYTPYFQFSGEFYQIQSSTPLQDENTKIRIFLGGNSKEVYALSQKHSGLNFLGTFPDISKIRQEPQEREGLEESDSPYSPYSNFFRSSHSLIVPRVNGKPIFTIPAEMRDVLPMTKSGSSEELRDYIGRHAEIGISEFIQLDTLYRLSNSEQEDILCFIYQEIFDKI